MRNIIFLCLILATLGFIPAQGDDVPRELKWERIYNWKNKNVKAYVDVKSLRKHKEDNTEYNIGMILFQRDRSTLVTTPDRKIMANMYASYFVADCSIGRIATLSDFYFNMNHLPTTADEPIVAYDYTDNIQDVVDVEKDDPILGALCPVYI